MELIRKLLVNAPVERGTETITDRFSGGRLKRRSGAAVLELNRLVAGVRCHREHCGQTNQPPGYSAHKRPLSLVTCDRSDFGDFKSLATSSKENGMVNRTSAGKGLALFRGFDPGLIVAAISTLCK